MATTNRTDRLFEADVGLSFSKPWGAYWLALLRVLVGYWFLHAGATKIMEGGFSAQGYLQFAAKGTIMEPIVGPFTGGIGLEFVNFMIPVGEFLIGLGLLVGLLVRLAAFSGAFLMVFFWAINAEWVHGMINGDLFGLLLFVTLIVFAAGRVFGLDGYVERTEFVQRHEKLRYILG